MKQTKTEALNERRDQTTLRTRRRSRESAEKVCPGSEALWRLDEENGTRCRTLTCFYRR